VGSGPYPEPGFINLDNHVFLSLARFWPSLGRVLPAGRRDALRVYFDATQQGRYARYDCRRPLHAGQARVDHILCSHFLEHVYPNEARAILAGFYEVLKPGGTVHLIVPDLRKLALDYIRGESSSGGRASDQFLRELLLSQPRAPSWRYRAMELLGFEGLQHRWMYDRESLEEEVREAGFSLRVTNDTPSLHVRKDDPKSLHVVAEKPR